MFGWVAAYRAAGIEALRAKPVPGRPPRLSGAQLRTLYTLIVGADPRQYGFPCALWTRDLVRQLIFARSPGLVSGCRQWRWGGCCGHWDCPPAASVSGQQDGERVVRWREQGYPVVQDDAARVGATIYLADEAGIRSDYHAGTTGAPVARRRW